MSDMLIQEVNEALRREKAERFWVDNRGAIIVLIVAIVVGTAGGTMYRNWKNERNAHFSDVLVQAQHALGDSKPDAAIALLDGLVKESAGEQRSIAQLWQARAELEAGKKEAAATTLKTLIQTAEPGSVWLDAACVWQTGVTGSFPNGCDASAESPLRGTKLELAAADALAQKDWVRARSLLASLSGTAAPNSEQASRARQLALLLPPEEAKAQTPAAKKAE